MTIIGHEDFIKMSNINKESSNTMGFGVTTVDQLCLWAVGEAILSLMP